MVREDNKYEDVRIVCYLLRLVWSHVEVGLKLNSRLIPINPDLFSSMPILLAYQPILCQLENSQNLPRKKKIEILKFFDQL